MENLDEKQEIKQQWPNVQVWLLIYIIILDPDERRRPTTVRSNDTLVDTPFQLISGFFHVNQGVLCCAGVCWRGGGGNRLAK